MSGHLFVVHGDLLGVACDAILVPSGSGVDQAGSVRAGHATSAWVGELGPAVQDSFLDDAPDASRPVVRVIDRDGIRRPAVWAGFSGDQGDESLAFYTRVVDAFIAHAGAHARADSESGPRPLMSQRPLVAMPLVGSGEGGRRDDRGGLCLESSLRSRRRPHARTSTSSWSCATRRRTQQHSRRVRASSSASSGASCQKSTSARLNGSPGLLATDDWSSFSGRGRAWAQGFRRGDLLSGLAERAGLNADQREELRHLEFPAMPSPTRGRGC